MDLAPGTVVERYTVESVLGSGGMAVVYLVRHNQLGSLHAMKALTVPTPDVRRRLLQEGRVQSSLRHPNVVAVTDTVEIDGMPALVMEYVRGPSLSDLLAAHRPTPAQAEDLALGLLRGVAAAHRAGLVHRDLKPANVLLSLAGGVPVPKITDFGLAKVLRSEGSGADRTRSGVAMGTPAYMAPEQIRDSRAVDHRADLFSLGAVLYELVTGRRAFAGRDAMELFQAVCSGSYTPLAEVAPKLPKRMADAIEAALRVDVADRVQSCDALLELWTGRKGAWAEADTAWDQRTLFTVASMGSGPDSIDGLPPLPQATDDRTFLLETERVHRSVEVGGATFLVREVAPRRFSMAEGRTVELTRTLLVGVDAVDEALWREVTGGDGSGASRAWEEVVAFCNALSERLGLRPAYTLSEPRPRRRYTLDDMGRMLYDLVPFERIAPILARFGEDTLAVLQREPERLAEVEGIGPKTAKRLGRRWDPWRWYTVGVTLEPDADGWRLPTEAEWAAYVPGNPDLWEWTADADPGPPWSEVPEPLPPGEVSDPAPSAGARRVLRRGAERRALAPDLRADDVGFRIVRQVQTRDMARSSS